MEYQGFDQVGEYTIVFQAKNVDGYAEPIQTTVTVPVKGTQPLAQLTGDINGDKIVDIFDLVLVAFIALIWFLLVSILIRFDLVYI